MPPLGAAYAVAVRARAVAVVVAALLLGACGGDGGANATLSTAQKASTTVTTFGGIPGAAQSVACAQDARTLQQASDLYLASHDGPAASIDALVAAGEIGSAPSNTHGYVISYDPTTGKVSAAGACTLP
jgi:hypothetical protein